MSKPEFDRGANVGLAFGGTAGVVLTSLVAAIWGAGHKSPVDPLKPILEEGGQVSVSPDNLAGQIAKDPALQERWKATREMMDRIDQKIAANLEQKANASKDAAERWRGQVRPEDSRGNDGAAR